ncbi:MAG: AAA family ATPase [Pseudomonadota bacterium]
MEIDFLSVECLEKLGLEQNPFIDHARDPFLFMDTQHEMSMNVLMDYLSNQNSTLVLLGEVGVGKTTHLRMLLRKGYQNLNFCTLRAKPKTTFCDIEYKIKERWRLPQESDEDPSFLDTDSEENLTTDEHIREYIEDDKHPVLIVDDAHRLQNDVLDQLLKLKHHVGLRSKNSMGLVLAAETNIQTKLAELEQTNPAATQIYQINVRAFDTAQCEDYLNYRLKQAGSTSQDIFSTEKISEIIKRSNGLPKHINKLARDELAKQCERGIAANTTPNNLQSSPSMRLGLILAGLIGLAVLLMALYKSTNETIEPIDLEISKPKLEQQNPQQSKPTSSQDSNKTKQAKDKLEAKSVSKPYVAPLVLGPLQEDKPTENSNKDNNEKAEEKLKLQTKEKPKTPEINKPTKNTSQSSSKYSSNWILQQDPNAYTVQIVASPNEQNLLSFIEQNALTKNTAYYQKSSSDKIWYVLVHGIYPSRDAALLGIEQLSDSLKKNTPYPIQIKFLHEIIQKQ